MNVVVVGAGLTGLSAAVSLVDSGIKPMVIEKTDRVGGLARSVVVDNQVFDIGVHTLYPPRHPVVHRLISLRSLKTFSRRISYALEVDGGKISPTGGWRSFVRYPLPLKLDLLKRMGYQPTSPHSLKDRLVASYGRWLYDKFFRAYIERKLPGFSGETVHGDWWGLGNVRDELNRFKDSSEPKGPELAKVIDRFKSSFWPSADPAIYPRGGIGELSLSLASFLRERQVEIRLNTAVSEIITEGNRLTQLRFSNGQSVRCGTLVWTGMLPDLIALLGLDWPGGLTYASIILVLLVFERKSMARREHLFEYSARRDVIFQRAYFNDFYSSDPDRFGICAEISCGKDTRRLDDATLVSRTIDGLRRLRAVGAEQVVASMILRENGSHPVYGLDYRQRLADLFSRVYSTRGIFPVGRSGSFNNLGMPSAMLSGWNIGKHCAREGEG